MKADNPQILIVNPWIHDFAAYDFWAKPIGVLSIASILRNHGFDIHYIDCLDRFHPNINKSNSKEKYGRGSYLKSLIPKPKNLYDIPRNFSRYGILPEWFKTDLTSLEKIDLILVTSQMTYWYLGVFETIKIIKEIFHEKPVILGGIYATLMFEHAKANSGADYIISGPGEKKIFEVINKYLNISPALQIEPDNLDSYPYPAFDLQKKISYIPIITSKGCPFSCSYCASKLLNPFFIKRNKELVLEEIVFWHKNFGVIDFIFYDDALLFDADNHIIPILESIIKKNLPIRFHTPNALHIKYISEEIAKLLFKANFKTLRLGLETADFEDRNFLDAKVSENEFLKAVSYLYKAGFNNEQIGAYLLAGLPEQSIKSIELSIELVKKNGVMPVIAYYSPIPNTPLWNKAVKSSRYDLEFDPIFTNNSILPCQKEIFSWDNITNLKIKTKINIS